MNWIKGLTLVVALLFVVNVHQSFGQASGKSRKRAAQANASRAVPVTEEVEGNGVTAEKASSTAKKNAVDRVEALVREGFGRAGWQPTEDLFSPSHLEEMKVIQVSKPPKQEGDGPLPGEKNYVAAYRIELNGPYLKEVIAKARMRKVEERHLLLARLLGGILALALVTAGYLRLEEMTRGYATKLLRLGAVVLLALVGAGLYLIGR